MTYNIDSHIKTVANVKGCFKLKETEMDIPYIPTISIKAKDFAAEMTCVNVQTKDLHSEGSITQEHIDNNVAVRKMLVERGIIPENLLAAEDVKKVERRLESEQKKVLRNKKK